jgi:hypothetical protein
MSSDTIESDGFGQAINLAQADKSAIWIYTVNANGACAGVHGVEELTIGTRREVEVCCASWIVTDNGSSDGSQCSVSSNGKTRYSVGA